MKAWRSGTLNDWRAAGSDVILGMLSTRLVETHAVSRETQIVAWRRQIVILQSATADLPAHFVLLIEYPLLRLRRKIDALLPTDAAVLILEFKVGDRSISMDDRRQVEDDALDLQDFHAGSNRHPIVPVVISLAHKVSQPPWPLCWHAVMRVFDANAHSLKSLFFLACGASTLQHDEQQPEAALPEQSGLNL